MASTATIKGGLHFKPLNGGALKLSASEVAAAKQALRSLGGSDGAGTAHVLLKGLGADTFAGGVAGAVRALPGFSSDTVSGGAAVSQSTTASKGLALSANPVKLAGPIVTDLKTIDPGLHAGAGQVITLGDHTTVKLVGAPQHPAK